MKITLKVNVIPGIKVFYVETVLLTTQRPKSLLAENALHA
jgi:hypothetical protein